MDGKMIVNPTIYSNKLLLNSINIEPADYWENAEYLHIMQIASDHLGITAKEFHQIEAFVRMTKGMLPIYLRAKKMTLIGDSQKIKVFACAGRIIFAGRTISPKDKFRKASAAISCSLDYRSNLSTIELVIKLTSKNITGEGTCDTIGNQTLKTLTANGKVKGIFDVHGGFLYKSSSISQPKKSAIIHKYYPNGNLEEYASKHQLTQIKIISIFKRILHSLESLKQHGVIHGEISQKNIFMDEKVQPVLGNFNMAIHVGQIPFFARPSCSSPEVMKQIHGLTQRDAPHIDTSSDLCSAGYLLYRLIYRKNHPLLSLRNKFSTKNKKQKRIVLDTPPALLADATSIDIYIRSMVMPNPKDRISLEKAIFQATEIERELLEQEEQFHSIFLKKRDFQVVDTFELNVAPKPKRRKIEEVSSDFDVNALLNPEYQS